MASELAYGSTAYPSLNHYPHASSSSVGGSQQAFSSPGTTNQYNQHATSGGSMQQQHQNGGSNGECKPISIAASPASLHLRRETAPSLLHPAFAKKAQTP